MLTDSRNSIPSLRRLLPVAMLLATTTACDPLSCQGRVTDGINQVRIDDIAIFPPLCVNNGTDFNGDVDITQQAQLDALSTCLRVKGNIFIHDSDDIVDLSAISKLQRIDQGYLLAFNNTALTEVALPALTNLEAGFAAIDNPELLRVLLPGLPVMKGDITLRNDPKLSQVDFKNIERINDAIFIIDNVAFNVSTGNLILADLPALTSIDGAFDALQVIEGSVEVHNTGLKSFKGLENLTQILNKGGAATARTKFRADKLNPGLALGIDFDDEFNIVAAGNPDFENFDGLQNLDVIVGDIFIGFNPALESFVGMDDLKAINGRLFVVGNANLINFAGLDGDNGNDNNDDGLSVINGDLIIGIFFDRFNQPKAGGNAKLVDFSGLDSLTTLTGNLVLAFNPVFEDFTGLERLPLIGKDFVMLGMEQDTFKGADVLTTIGGSLIFGELLRNDGQPFDPKETNETLKLVDITGAQKDPKVKFNPNNGQNGFDALTTIGGNLIFAFSDFTDMRLSDPDTANVTTVGGSLRMYGNNNPDSLAGFQTVNSLGGFVVNFAVDKFGELKPFENNGLSDFSNLNVTQLGAGGLHIGFNSDINNAAFASLPNFTVVQGSVTMARVVNQNNLGPTNLNDLNITTIGGDLTVCAVKNGDNAPINANLGNLTSLTLNATNTVNGSVFVGFCTNLTDTNMTVGNVGGTFEMTNLPALVTVNGLAQLGAVGALQLHDLSRVENITIPNLANVAGNLEVVRNPVLRVVDFGLNQVGGNLRFVDLGVLPNLAGLAGLNVVNGDLDIIDCDAVQNTIGLNQLDAVGGTLRLRRLDTITNEAQLNGRADLTFNQLRTVGSLEISDMGNLEDLAGLQGVTTVTGTLLISGNPKLETLFGLQGLTSIGRKLSIIGNPKLEFAFFDDDNLDRVPDFDNQNGINNEANDPDGIFEAGLLDTLTTIGDPEIDSGVVIGGRTGVIELRDNPKLDEAEFFQKFVDRLDDYSGLFFLCGNEGSEDVVSAADRLTSFAICPLAQDGQQFSGAEPDGA